MCQYQVRCGSADDITHLCARGEIYDSAVFAVFELLYRILGRSECRVGGERGSSLARDYKAVALSIYNEVVLCDTWQLKCGRYPSGLRVVTKQHPIKQSKRIVLRRGEIHRTYRGCHS